MLIDGPLISATFIDRPNRFITTVKINGELHKSHLPDPGRLKELLIPGSELLVRPARLSEKRKTAYTTIFIKVEGQLISLVSTLPNYFIKEELKNNRLSIFKNFKLEKPEIIINNHRFDFLLLDDKAKKFYLEVKSVTYVENRIAKFPDAITDRGRRHALALMDLVTKGKRAGILFVCQRSDADLFMPMWERDSKFSKALLNAYEKGVKVWCITLNISRNEITFNKEIPVKLELNN
tara:strand:+ start:3128 stop:3835 length:708 start_codon:yes stop_codon:yes gene_type:complete